MSTTDFFADLERQLVDATHERPRRIRRARARRAAAPATGLVALVAASLVLASTLQSDTTQQRSAPAAPPPATTVGVDPRTGAVTPLTGTTVAVLNGTGVPGLGKVAADRLSRAGAHIVAVSNAPRQDVTTTQFLYMPGKHVQSTLIAAALQPRADITARPVTLGLRDVLRAIKAGHADVVVVVGADLVPAGRP